MTVKASGMLSGPRETEKQGTWRRTQDAISAVHRDIHQAFCFVYRTGKTRVQRKYTHLAHHCRAISGVLLHGELTYSCVW